ncbi:hypothetical protein [Emcibacter sp. SYSU 3D8]|uniref:hypothetical protein n=1 Tax=Emcibacter sp. SYSU 3D8 TaxID=3133969 RepID=UPI0031FE7634
MDLRWSQLRIFARAFGAILGRRPPGFPEAEQSSLTEEERALIVASASRGVKRSFFRRINQDIS